MKRRIRGSALGRELLLLCVCSLCISFLFYRAAAALGMELFSGYYDDEEHISRMEDEYIGELQEYLDANKVSLEDLGRIDAWVSERENIYLKLFLKGELIYDTLYGATAYQEIPEERQENYGGMNAYSLKVQETTVDALLFTYDFQTEDTIMTVSLVLSFVLFVGLLLWGVRKKIWYLVRLCDELEMLSGELTRPITVAGNDEITKVACGIDRLRLSVIEKLEKEKAAYQANIDLVTSLSHDIKTPLTSVISYIELAGEKAKDDRELSRYIGISREKAMCLRELTNDLFEHFLLHSNDFRISFETVNGTELIEQLLEENVFHLEMRGISVVRNVSDISVKLRVNVNLIYSVFENLFSNIEKYADLTKGIWVRYALEDRFLVFSVGNSKNKTEQRRRSSTKIGLRNCRAVMEKHGGSLELTDAESMFEATLRFPIAE